MSEINICEHEIADNESAGQQPLMKLVNKRSIAAMLGLSVRQLDNYLRTGMPHFRLGARCIRFEPNEVLSWIRERFRTQRFGPTRRGRQDGVSESGGSA